MNMIRVADFLFSMFGLILSSPLFLIIYMLCWAETGAPIFKQIRVGKNKRHFTLYKFRTMQADAPSLATHMVDATKITRVGRLLRRTKLDELPQLLNVLKGEMSLIGPRPCLPEQLELIEARERLGVFQLRPGISGLAQVKGIDMSTPQYLAETDAKMLRYFSLKTYARLIYLTLVGKGRGDRVMP